MEKTSYCSICKRDLPIEEFDIAYRTGLAFKNCKPCNKARNRKASTRCHEEKYGLVEGEYELLFILQDGECKICGTHQKDLTRKLQIDHDHSTGKVRGLLCSYCNTAIGMVKENHEIAIRLSEYLKSSM